MADRNLGFGPARKDVREYPPADLTVQTAHAVHRTAAPNREVRHVEGLAIVLGIMSAERQHVAERDAQFVLGIITAPIRHQPAVKAVETGRDRRVRGEKITRPGHRQRLGKRHRIVFHESARTLQSRERRVSLIEMADVCMDTQSPQKPPSANPQHPFLLQPQFRSAAVEFGCDAAVFGQIFRIVGIQKIKLRSPHLYLPGSDPQHKPRQLHGNPQPFAIGVAQRTNRKLPRLVERPQSDLIPAESICWRKYPCW